MRLKKIRLAGFKSFVDPTNIPFPGEMTAIVGPNGCGKSNVIDAVRWVLGESSAKNLRGDAMTDVIFNGSSARKPVSQCSVELVFDNSAGRIAGEYARYNELSVKRVVTKEAISSYMLNGSKCRKKDITDLFLGTGLGPRSYAIIEQGMISRLIESKPHELRVFIEEAAGISKYKERRRETQTRINHTNDNLDRLEDVRLELSEQLEKLKRQATAATKYKALKQEERDLKANLATLRWMTQTRLVEVSEKAISDFQQALSDLVASKQNDESSIQSLQNELSIHKQAANDVQTNIFSIGNEITKIEQSQIFAKKRLGQIQREKEQILASQQSLTLSLDAIDDEVITLTAQIEHLEPEKFVIEQQFEEVEGVKAETQDKLDTIELQHKKDDDAFLQKKHQLQQLHGKLQQTLSLQQRTQQRIGELELEKSELTLADDKQITDLRSVIEDEKRTTETDALRVAELTQQLASQQRSERETEKALSAVRNALFRENARLESLLALQSETTNTTAYPAWLDQHKLETVWQAFSVDKAYSACLETVLQLFDHVMVYSGERPSMQQLFGEHELSLWFQETFTTDKVPQSLASHVHQAAVPQLFNYILIKDDLVETQENTTDLSNLSYIDKAGNWLATSMLLKPKISKGKLERAEEIRQVEKDIQAHNEDIIVKEAALEHLSMELAEQTSLLEAKKVNLEEAKRVLSERETNLRFAELQETQQKEQQTKILIELEKQRDIMSEESESLECLNQQIEELSIFVADGEDEKNQREQITVQLKSELQMLTEQANAIRSNLHQHQLQLQQIKNSLQLSKEQQNSKKQLLDTSLEKLANLTEEAENLSMPADEQQEKLQDMLLQKQRLTSKQAETSSKISELENDVKQLEQGSSSVNIKIEKLKSEIESERLKGESAKVRAQGFIEQLTEMKVQLNTMVDDMPEEQDEAELQQRLDKTTSAIQRLGAVNLAAVDEYTEQSERKAHLDAQNDDLVAALETLENAMRKIDRETKMRFKTTFDKVNNDLKTLFPKVFGGGSAYLALTEDDLLDTGVTIMARPPGKKNSTIQLLSGGEKALTALSLVFAIFRLNPSPFCLLDEVDAPLDDANVGRFCKLVMEMSKTVQFIYITHNKVAMEMASHLTGVTMAEPGVSRMVSVNMEEALEIAE